MQQESHKSEPLLRRIQEYSRSENEGGNDESLKKIKDSIARFISSRINIINAEIGFNGNKTKNKNKKSSNEISAKVVMGQLVDLLEKKMLGNQNLFRESPYLLMQQGFDVPAINNLLRNKALRVSPDYQGEKLFELKIIKELADDLEQLFLAILKSGSEDLIRILGEVLIEQYDYYNNPDVLDLVDLFGIIENYAPDSELRRKAADINIALMSVDSRTSPVNNQGPEEQRIVEEVKSKRSIRNLVLIYLLGQHRLLEHAPSSGSRLYRDFGNEIDASYINQEFPFFSFGFPVERESELYKEVIRHEFKYQGDFLRSTGWRAMELQTPGKHSLVWWSEQRLAAHANLSELAKKFTGATDSRLKKVEQQISDLIMSHLKNEQTDTPTLDEEVFFGWLKFVFPDLGIEKSVEELGNEAVTGFYPITKSGQRYMLKDTIEREKQAIDAGLLGLQFRLISSEKNNGRALIEATLLMVGNKKFTFYLDKSQMTLSSLSNIFRGHDDKLLKTVLSALSKIINRETDYQPQNGNPDIEDKPVGRSGGNRVDQSAHPRILVGKAPGRDWQDQESNINIFVQELYGFTLGELNFHFVMAQIQGDEYLDKLENSGLVRIIKRCLSRKLELLEEVTEINKSVNYMQTMAMLRALSGIELSEDVVLLTIVEENPYKRDSTIIEIPDGIFE